MVIGQPGEQSYSSGVNVTDGEEGPSMETSLSKTQENEMLGRKKNKYLHLKKKHLSYPAKFKPQLIHVQQGGMTTAKPLKKYSSFRLDEPKICTWKKQKKEVKKAAAGQHRNILKIHPARLEVNLYAKLLKIFTS